MKIAKKNLSANINPKSNVVFQFFQDLGGPRGDS